MQRAAPLEAKYIVKIISGDLRIGLKESLVEEAMARAFEVSLDQVKRANMLLGDLGETLRLASEKKLAEARLQLFHAIDFMLASPVESSEEALSYFQNASVEDKYDGIRAQAHISRERNEVRIFSRTRDEITESFPELPAALASLPFAALKKKTRFLMERSSPGKRMRTQLSEAALYPSARCSSASAGRRSPLNTCMTPPSLISFSTSSTRMANCFSIGLCGSEQAFSIKS
jgi:hypothetical protein